MRLTPEEVVAIKECTAQHFGADAVVRLFGSRVRDDLRGGDIDLHIVASSNAPITLAAECDFVEDLAGRIGDQRIDMIVQPRGYEKRPIDHIAFNEGVVL